MRSYAYGQQPSDITATALGLGWARGVRHLKSLSAAGSFWHTHGEIQLLYCLRGEFTYEFEDRAPVVLASGQAIVIPPDTPHRHLRAIDPVGHRVEILLARRTGKSARQSPIPMGLTNVLLAQLERMAYRPFACGRHPAEDFVALDALAARAASGRLTDVELARARILVCRLLLDSVQPQASAAPGKNEAKLMSAAVEWLEEHHAECVRLPRLVTYMGYSRARFFTLFKRHTGLTPSAWLTNYRLRRVRTLLTETDNTLEEIARVTGFSTPQYLCAVFRQRVGKTPDDWRNASRREASSAEMGAHAGRGEFLA